LKFHKNILQQFLVICIIFYYYDRTAFFHNRSLPHRNTIQCQTTSSVDEIFTHLFYKTFFYCTV
jgi:hypothetical protein